MNRDPRGIPTGGRFAASGRPVAGVAIGDGEDGHRIDDLIELTPAGEHLLDAIRDAGGRPLIVGGSVRDAFMHRIRGRSLGSKDVDIEVYGIDADRLSAAVSRVGAANEVGVSFGVIKVSVGDEAFDVSLPRRDSKIGDGHRGFAVEVDHALSFADAFGRRDFTINSIGWDPASGEVIDLYGGICDIEAGILRHTSDSFGEDPDRVLRGIGFAGRFGFDLAPETVAECRALADRFGELPVSRVAEEWRKIAVLAPQPSRSLRALHQVGWERHFPEISGMRDVPQDPHWHPEGSVEVHAAMAADHAARLAREAGLPVEDREVVVMAAMLHDVGKARSTFANEEGRIVSPGHQETGEQLARSFLQRIGAGGKLADKVAPIIGEHMAVHSLAGREPTPKDVRRLIRRLAGDGTGPTIQQWAMVCESDSQGRGPGARPSPARRWVEIAEAIPAGSMRRIVRGEHLIAAGMRPGPEFSPILADALDAQDSGEIVDDESGIRWLQARLGPAS